MYGNPVCTVSVCVSISVYMFAKIMRGECNSKTGKLSFTGLDTAEPTLILCKDNESMAHHKVRNVFFILRNSALYLPLYKIICTRQYKSKLSLRSFALPLYKISCTRQYKSKLSLRLFAISLYKIICTRQYKSKLSLRSFAISLYKISCTREIESKLSFHSFALSIQTGLFKEKNYDKTLSGAPRRDGGQCQLHITGTDAGLSDA